jgi:hypothetical protein
MYIEGLAPLGRQRAVDSASVSAAHGLRGRGARGATAFRAHTFRSRGLGF